MKAVPTEWNGIRFRSKSEACFAMYLDHQQQQTGHVRVAAWDYEPSLLTLEDGYTPDFLLILQCGPSLWCKLIEYKPSKPTDTYAAATLEKLEILSNHMGLKCYPCIQYGSFWENDGDHQATTIIEVRGELRTNIGWADWGDDDWALRQKISQHRFDLVSELSEWKEHLHG